MHQADAAGDCSTTAAMLLVPTHDSPGVNMASLAESQALRSGSYTDVPVPADWIKVSRKLAMQSKRAMAEKGMLDTSISAADVGAVGVRYVLNKVARAQLGTGLYQVWMKDIIKHCGAKALFVCDFAHGVGEVMKAAVNCKVAEAATTTWGQSMHVGSGSPQDLCRNRASRWPHRVIQIVCERQARCSRASARS